MDGRKRKIQEKAFIVLGAAAELRIKTTGHVWSWSLVVVSKEW
jgi:hypothetical protein